MYPLVCIVAMVGAYVDGLQIHFSSSIFTSHASVNLAGGLVKC